MSKKIISFFSLFCLVLLALPFFPQKSLAQNIGSLKNVVTTGFSFTMDLAPGYTDQDVKELQRVLNADVDTVVSLDDAGSKGRETKYFDDKTKAAVIKFQEKYRDVILTPSGLTKGTGFVGKATRTKLNLLIGVFNTYPSTGVPESTGVTAVIVPQAPVISPASTANSGISMTICQFINILKNISVISETRATQAGTSFNCPAMNNNATIPTVVLKINGERDTVSVPVNSTVTLSWISQNATTCSSNGGSKPLSGSKDVFVDSSGTFTISCTGAGGSTSDTVTVVAINSSSASTTVAGNYDYSYLLPNFSGNGLATQKVLNSNGNSGDVAVVPSSSSLKTDSRVTLESWVKPTSWRSEDGMDNTKDEVIISKGNLGGNIDYALSLNNGKLVYSNNDSSLWTCNTVVPLNVWTHVAATVDESARNISLYVNGAKVSSICEGARGTDTKASIDKQYAISNSTETANIFIGNYSAKYCDASLKSNGFIGRLDDIRIWNLIRTETEIKNSMASSVKGVSGLVADWTFDNGTVSDITNYNNNGLLKGGMSIVSDSTASSTVVAASNVYSFNYNSSLYTPCESGNGDSEATTTPEDEPFEITFGGIVEYVSSCGSTNNPNQYSSVVIKSLDGTRPVVGIISGSETAWQRNFGGDFGKSDPNVKLVLRHSPHTGAPLPKVGDCVLGTSTGEPDVCETSEGDESSVEGLPAGTSLQKACKSTGGQFRAGGIIKKLGTDSSGSCKTFSGNVDSSDSGFIEKLGHLGGYTSIGALWNIGGDTVSIISGGTISLPSTSDIGRKIDKVFGW